MKPAAVLLLGVLAARSLLGADSPAVLTSEFIYEQAPYPSCHASTIVETTQHEMVAAWFGGTAEKNPDVGIWVSRHENGRWTPSVEVANGVQADGTRYPTWNPVLFQPRGGLLLLFYKVGPSPQTWWGLVRTSADGGRTWGEARRLPEGVLGPIKNKPVQLADGTIVAGSSVENLRPFSTVDQQVLIGSFGVGLLLAGLAAVALRRLVGARPRTAPLLALAIWLLGVGPVAWAVNKTIFRRGSEWRVHFERSSDGGDLWSNTAPLNDGVKLGAIQPSILFHDQIGGNKLQAIGRTRQGKVFTLFSDDGGRHWSVMSLLDVPNPSAGTDAVTLADRRHLLVCNPVKRGRTPLAVFVSRDGRKWTQALVLEDQPGEYSYPAVIQASDGRVHITYTWKRQRVKHVVLDPAKLPTEMSRPR